MTSIFRAYSICSHQRVSAPAHPAPLCPRGCSRATAPLSSPGVTFQLLRMIATQINPAILLVWQARKAFTSRVHKTIAPPSISSSKESKFPWQQARSAGAKGHFTEDIFASLWFCVSSHLKFSPETGAPSYQPWFLLFSTTDALRPFYIAIWMFVQEVVRHISLLKPHEQRRNHHFFIRVEHCSSLRIPYHTFTDFLLSRLCMCFFLESGLVAVRKRDDGRSH